MVWEEVQLFEDRENLRMASEAVLLQMTISTMFSKNAGEEFQKRIKEMTRHG